MIHGITSLLGMAYLVYIIVEMSWCLLLLFVGLLCWIDGGLWTSIVRIFSSSLHWAYSIGLSSWLFVSFSYKLCLV